MKRLLLSLLACGMFASARSQTEPAAPCCGIIATDIKNNLVVARDNTTGRLYQFKADAMDMRSIRNGDAVNITGNKVSAINSSTRTYSTFRPDYGAPCCAVVSIQVDGLDPCCSAVTIKNNSTNTTFSISVPRQIAATLKTGQAVSMDAANLAVVQSSYGNSNGQMASYGYPATSVNEPAGNENAAEKWVITPVSTIKGVLGMLDVNFPPDVYWGIQIYKQADNKYEWFTSVFSSKSKSYSLAPGVYLFDLMGAQVENVPIQKGHETRLKAGFLSVVSEGNWHLYNEAKEKIITSGHKPNKIALPVGSYQLSLGGQFYPVVIKDGKTVEY